jgi:hypothetical protein
MINFNQALFNLVKAGKVSEQEALSKASNPQALEMNFKGIVSPPDGKPTRRRRSAPVGASVLTLSAGRTPRTRSQTTRRRGASGRAKP